MSLFNLPTVEVPLLVQAAALLRSGIMRSTRKQIGGRNASRINRVLPSQSKHIYGKSKDGNLVLLDKIDDSISYKKACPRLSLLLPAFENASGVIRILNHFLVDGNEEIECLIFDDSSTDCVENAVKSFVRNSGRLVTYQRNRAKQGAVHNWNSLLDAARGEFVLFMHHDESPFQVRFFAQLLSELTANVDGLILNCEIVKPDGNLSVRHYPLWLKKAILSTCPSYLYRRNVLGSPSIFVVRRNLALKFNPNLTWLVDVDWFVRLLKQPNFRLINSPKLIVLSFPNSGSITSSLDKNKKKIIQQEMNIIESGQMGFVGKMLAPPSLIYQIIAICEAIMWSGVWLATKFMDSLRPRSLPGRFSQRSEN